MAYLQLQIETMPHPKTLQDLAQRLADSEWVAVGTPAEADQATATTERPEYYRIKRDAPTSASTSPLDLAEVRVEVWEYQLAPRGRTLRLAHLTSATASTNGYRNGNSHRSEQL